MIFSTSIRLEIDSFHFDKIKLNQTWGCMTVTEFWWSTDGEQLLILPRDVVVEYALERRALKSSTWGEVKEVDSLIYIKFLATTDKLAERNLEKMSELPEKVAEGQIAIKEVQARVSELREQLPPDGEVFDPKSTSAYLDGDWPVDVRALMHDHVPKEVVRECGDSYVSVLNGDFLEIDAAQKDIVIATIEKMGHTCTENPMILALNVEF